MSYIDCFDHSYVGSFMNLPVYHPLQNLREDDEFGATPENLVIGGGSGEHPGLVINNLDICVWKFLEFCCESSNKETDNIKFYKDYYEVLGDELYNYRAYDNMIFHGWSMELISRFTIKIDNEYEEGVKYYKNKKELENSTTEEKLHIMLGEFIYFSGKHLISDQLNKFIKQNVEKLEKDEVYISPTFYALKVAPKGYPNSGGRYIETKENGETKTICGLRFEDEEFHNPVLFKKRLDIDLDEKETKKRHKM